MKYTNRIIAGIENPSEEDKKMAALTAQKAEHNLRGKLIEINELLNKKEKEKEALLVNNTDWDAVYELEASMDLLRRKLEGFNALLVSEFGHEQTSA